MSVTFAPRARIAVNASWPGVSRNVILRPSTSVWYAPMCWVIPPASVVDDLRRADRVQQRRLAVIDVAHDRDHRRPGAEILVRVLDDLGLDVVVGGVLDHDLTTDLGRDQLDLLVGERLGRGPHLVETHEDLDDLRHRHAEGVRQGLDGDARLDGRRDRSAAAAPARAASGLGAAIAQRPRVTAAHVAALDHDAALAPRRASARADRAIGLVGTVSHQVSV